MKLETQRSRKPRNRTPQIREDVETTGFESFICWQYFIFKAQSSVCYSSYLGNPWAFLSLHVILINLQTGKCVHVKHIYFAFQVCCFLCCGLGWNQSQEGWVCLFASHIPLGASERRAGPGWGVRAAWIRAHIPGTAVAFPRGHVGDGLLSVLNRSFNHYHGVEMLPVNECYLWLVAGLESKHRLHLERKSRPG